jgi:chromosome segregation ATPase
MNDTLDSVIHDLRRCEQEYESLRKELEEMTKDRDCAASCFKSVIYERNELIEQLSKFESDAIGFANFLSDNEWRKRTATHHKYVGKWFCDFDLGYKTLEELFTLYKQQNP